MEFVKSGILFLVMLVICCLIYGILLLSHYNMENTRLYNIIIRDIIDYVPVFATLISLDLLISLSIDIPIPTLFNSMLFIGLNCMSFIFIYPLTYLLTSLYCELHDRVNK